MLKGSLILGLLEIKVCFKHRIDDFKSINIFLAFVFNYLELQVLYMDFLRIEVAFFFIYYVLFHFFYS